MSLDWRCFESTARRPTATGHDQKWCSQLGPGAPQTQALEALCRRAAVGKASKGETPEDLLMLVVPWQPPQL